MGFRAGPLASRLATVQSQTSVLSAGQDWTGFLFIVTYELKQHDTHVGKEMKSGGREGLANAFLS